MKHKWGDKADFPLAHKSERTCRNGCGITKVSRHEYEGGRAKDWTEFHRDGERIQCGGTPACTGKPKAVTYGMQGYPL